MLLLKTLGGLSVEADGAPAAGAAQQRKTLALLALLAASRRGISRDKLIAYLWPESDTEHARNTLKQACHVLRRDVHAHDLFLGAMELRLNPNVIASDIGTLEDALDRGDLAPAVAAYTGPFLDGFYLAGAGEFERWMEETRAALKARVGEALESLATQAASSGDVQTAVKWFRRRAALDPLAARPALGLMRALIAAGERTAALESGRVHATLVRQELGIAPDPAVRELLERLREEGMQRAATASAEAVPSPAVAMSGTATVRAPFRAARIGRRLALGTAVVVVAGVVVVASDREPASLDPELLAVAPFEILGRTLEPWREDLVHLLSRTLDGAVWLRTVPPTVAIRRSEGSADLASAAALGRRTGAGLVLFGDLSSVGPDSVRLRAGVLDVGKGRTLAEFERVESADRIDRLADSLSLDVMRALVPTTSWVYGRLRSPGTRSLPALKAFLQGERYFRQFSLDSAIASYERVIALDSTFAIALRAMGLARSWNLKPAAEHYLVRADVFNRGLSPRDSLMVVHNSLLPGLNDPGFHRLVQRKEVALGAALERYFEDPEVWHEVGETQHHLGFAWADSTWNRARRSFDQAIALDSGFAPAYIHPVEIALKENDSDAALRYVRGYLAIPSVFQEGGGMRLLSLLLDRQRTGQDAFDRELETASLPAVNRLAIAIRSWPDAEETQIAVTRRLVTHARASGLPVDALLANVLVFRGHLAEARGVVGTRFVMPAFMELAELGAIPRETVETALVRLFDHPDSPGDGVVFPWLMGGPCYRTWDAALWWASRRDTASLQRLVQREDSAARTVNRAVVAPYARPVPEVARAALALARGDTTTALRRFLAFPDSSCPGAQQRRAVQFRLLAAAGRDAEAAWVWDRLYERRVPLLFERARVAERLGDRPTAIHYYEFVLQAWLHADPELQPVVAKARAGLRRLAVESRR